MRCPLRKVVAEVAAPRQPTINSSRSYRLHLQVRRDETRLKHQKGCGLWTLSGDFVSLAKRNIPVALTAAHLNAGVIFSGDSVAIGV